jgi:hypothetical protein
VSATAHVTMMAAGLTSGARAATAEKGDLESREDSAGGALAPAAKAAVAAAGRRGGKTDTEETAQENESAQFTR